MTHESLFYKFREMTIYKDDDILMWFPNGKNCIRVRMSDLSDVVFTYQSEKIWKIESMESYLNSIGK